MYRVLIVDDEAMIRKGLHQHIPWEQLGFAVVGVAGSAARALAILEEKGADVLLTDIQMPGLSGLELCEQALARLPEMKLVIISGYDRFDYALHAIKLHVDDYLLKPIKPEQVRRVFRGLRQQLDEERAQARHLEQGRHTEERYALLRGLGLKLLREEPALPVENGAQLFLLQLDGAEAPVGRAAAELAHLFSERPPARVGGLFAAVLPESGALQLAEQALALCAGVPGLRPRAVVSAPVRQPEDLLPEFLSAAGCLDEAEDGGLTLLQGQGGGFAGEIKRKYIACLEAGHAARLDAITGELFAALEKRALPGAALLCQGLILDLCRYFCLGDMTGFAAVDGGMAPESPEELRARFCADLARLVAYLRAKADSPAAQLVQRAKAEIAAQYADCGFALAALADKLHVSYNYLSTVFTHETGRSLKQYLTGLRMEHARRLLLDRRHKISQIAQLVGFCNARHFADAFRKYYGVSASEYLQRLGGKDDW